MSNKAELVALLEELEKRSQYNKLKIFSETDKFLGNYKKEEYPIHMKFMEMGSSYRLRSMIAGNRAGKSYVAAVEVAYHATGLYPDWWKGRKFNRPVKMWLCGVTNESVAGSIHTWLHGRSRQEMGTGLIPKECMTNDAGDIMCMNMAGVPGVVGQLTVKHYTDGMFDGYSVLEYKAYSQGPDKFQAAQIDVIWLDEDSGNSKIFSECVTRTAALPGEDGGIIICTFTPLKGLSEQVLSFMPDGMMPKDGIHPDGLKYACGVTWDDVPHLTSEDKKALLAGYSEHEIEVRTKGLPYLGTGAVFPYTDEDITYDPTRFKIGPHFPKAYGMDVGWHDTSAVFGAIDPDTNIVYIYDEYHGTKAQPPIHSSAIKSRGRWMYGAIDPHADEVSKIDGQKLFDLYRDEDLNLIKANNTREASVTTLKTMFENGTLKISKNLVGLLTELHLYHRDDHGKIVKKNDHRLDALRYLIMTGLDWASIPPESYDRFSQVYENIQKQGKSPVTGY